MKLKFNTKALMIGSTALWLTLLLSLFATYAAAQNRLVVEQGMSVILPIDEDYDTVFVSDTTIADASISPSNRVFVFGKSVGETTLIATATDMNQDMMFTVVVTHKLSELKSVLRKRFPREQVSVESARGSILLTGLVSSEIVRKTLVATVSGFDPETTIIDRLSVANSNIVRLELKLLEVSRSQVENYGIDWAGTVASNGFFLGTSGGGAITVGKNDAVGTSLSATLDLLVSSGIATVAQETVLSTVNGEEALFSVGGEIPIPTFISDNEDGSNGNFRLDYKFIGTQLAFTPSVAPGNKLRLLINSTLSSQGQTASTVNGNTFPNLNTRSFRTNVELKDRQPFVIAGVSRSDTQSDLRQDRGGAFSRLVDSIAGKDRLTANSQELVVIVTPLLSDRAPADLRASLPAPVSNLEYIFSRGGIGAKTKGRGKAVFGAAGFRY
ncbi:MAG: type II and III secretion system protein family protein [Woeseiaceae bacterium]